uniref:Endo-beta-N-acetylglucosaminidase n=1 Tax=Lynx canadensis TaxID=61383 RepID=A0A667I2C1_LYNCA
METAGPRTRAAARLGAHATREEQRKRRPVRRWQRRRIGEEQEEAVFREVVSFTRDPLPARYYDKDTTKPISFYLPSLEELLAWTPDAEDSFNVALEPLKCRQPPLSSRRPRTLLCHDMMGGYLDDKVPTRPSCTVCLPPQDVVSRQTSPVAESSPAPRA